MVTSPSQTATTGLRTPAMRLVLLSALLTIAHGVHAEWRHYQGHARDLDTGAPLYGEQHYLRFEGERLRERLVLYTCPGGGSGFAHKRLDYSRSSTAPAFEMRDARGDWRQGLAWQEPDRATLFAGPLDEPATKSARIVGDGLVADAGFDEFVRAHWDELSAGRPVALRFGLPSRGTSHRFRLVPLGTRPWRDGSALAFELKLGGPLGLIAPSVRLLYDRDSRRLLRYEGLSDLRTADGRPILARIEFPEPPRALPAAEAESVRNPALSTC